MKSFRLDREYLDNFEYFKIFGSKYLDQKDQFILAPGRAYAKIFSCLFHVEPRNLQRSPYLGPRWSGPFWIKICDQSIWIKLSGFTLWILRNFSRSKIPLENKGMVFKIFKPQVTLTRVRIPWSIFYVFKENFKKNRVVKLPAGLDIFQGFNISCASERRQAG